VRRTGHPGGRRDRRWHDRCARRCAAGTGGL